MIAVVRKEQGTNRIRLAGSVLERVCNRASRSCLLAKRIERVRLSEHPGSAAERGD